jgi:hypothetical protein
VKCVESCSVSFVPPKPRRAFSKSNFVVGYSHNDCSSNPRRSSFDDNYSTVPTSSTLNSFFSQCSTCSISLPVVPLLVDSICASQILIDFYNASCW